MPKPTGPSGSWFQGSGSPSQLRQTTGQDYELFEEDGDFVLNVELPGFDGEELTVTWDDGVLHIAAEHEEARRGQRKTYRRRFRFPKAVDEDDITARYTNGILEVRLPLVTTATVSGKEIDIQS